MELSKKTKVKLINSDLDNGTEEYYMNAVTIVADCRTNEEVIELLKEVWFDGREFGNKELETFQPDDPFDNKHGHEDSEGRIRLVSQGPLISTGYKTIIPKLIAETMLGLKKDRNYQRLLWAVEKDGLLYKIVVKRKLKKAIKARPI